MRKVTFLIAFLILSAVSSAKAEKVQVAEVIDSTITAPTVSVSSFSATQMDSTATAMPLRKFVAIQNFDANYRLWCNFNTDVGVDKGFFVPENGAIISIPMAYGAPSSSWGPQARLTIYCITANPTGPSKAAFFQGY